MVSGMVFFNKNLRKNLNYFPESCFFHLEMASSALSGVMLSVSDERISSKTISSSLNRAPVNEDWLFVSVSGITG